MSNVFRLPRVTRQTRPTPSAQNSPVSRNTAPTDTFLNAATRMRMTRGAWYLRGQHEISKSCFTSQSSSTATWRFRHWSIAHCEPAVSPKQSRSGLAALERQSELGRRNFITDRDSPTHPRIALPVQRRAGDDGPRQREVLKAVSDPHPLVLMRVACSLFRPPQSQTAYRSPGPVQIAKLQVWEVPACIGVQAAAQQYIAGLNSNQFQG
jgi:hypothetical protein